MHVDPAHSFGAPNPFFRRNEIEALRTAVLRLLVVLHLVHFCPGHGLLVSPMSPSSMRHSVVGHLVLAHLILAHLVILHFILLHLSAGRRRTAGKGRYNARTSQQDGANDGRTYFSFQHFWFLLRCVTLARRSPR